MERNTVNHSAHSTWRCQYHIVFAPKFRRKVIYGELKADIGYILRKLCEEKKVEIIEAEACVVVKKSRHEKYLFLICFFKSRHEEYFCRSCFFKSGHGQ